MADLRIMLGAERPPVVSTFRHYKVHLAPCRSIGKVPFPLWILDPPSSLYVSGSYLTKRQQHQHDTGDAHFPVFTMDQDYAAKRPGDKNVSAATSAHLMEACR
jgi:hypothetical protein